MAQSPRSPAYSCAVRLRATKDDTVLFGSPDPPQIDLENRGINFSLSSLSDLIVNILKA